jgi:hypothetical protein
MLITCQQKRNEASTVNFYFLHHAPVQARASGHWQGCHNDQTPSALSCGWQMVVPSLNPEPRLVYDVSVLR